MTARAAGIRPRGACHTASTAPVDGAVGTGTFAGHAKIGAHLIDNVTGLRYTNTGTLASPVWSRSLTAAAVPAANVLGGPILLFQFVLAAGALADTDIVTTEKIRVIDAWSILQGAGVANTTLQVKNSATAITSTMIASGSDKDLTRITTIDDAQADVSAGGTLRVTSATGATHLARHECHGSNPARGDGLRQRDPHRLSLTEAGGWEGAGRRRDGVAPPAPSLPLFPSRGAPWLS